MTKLMRAAGGGTRKLSSNVRCLKRNGRAPVRRHERAPSQKAGLRSFLSCPAEDSCRALTQCAPDRSGSSARAQGRPPLLQRGWINGVIAVPGPVLPCRGDQALDLFGGQVLAGAALGLGSRTG